MATQNTQFKTFKLSQLRPAAYNPKVVSDKALNGLKKSLEKFGCVEPIVVNVRDGRNVIVGGHQRHKALIRLHGPDCDVVCVTVDLNDTDEKMLNACLWNPEIQGSFIQDLSAHIESLKASISEVDYIELMIDSLRKSLESGPAVGDEFFNDGAVATIRESKDFESMAFVFPKDQIKIVKSVITKKGKTWLSEQIVKLCKDIG